MYIYIYIYIYMLYMYVYIYMLYMYVYIYMLYMYVYIPIYSYICIPIPIRSYICIRIPIYIYTYICPHIPIDPMAWLNRKPWQDGRSSSLTAPNGPAQQRAITGALRLAGTPTGHVLHVVHGTNREKMWFKRQKNGNLQDLIDATFMYT